MELVNRTPLAARLLVTDPQDGGPRLGILVAKATFRIGAEGGTELDADDPLPVLDKDQETELGLLPRDDLPREDDAFEVTLLGRAHAPGGEGAPRATVALQVGEVRRELAVFGERAWQGEGPGARPGEPRPFTSLPLTWDRAFGGSADVEVDRESVVTVSDPRNPAGRGFEAASRARELGKFLAAPEGYPRLLAPRSLPNLEDPGALVREWEDAPRPCCWAPVPMETAFHVERGTVPPSEPGGPLTLTAGIHHRAHPDWVIARPPAGAQVLLEGATPEGVLGFGLPRLRVVVDYVLGAASGSDELMPHMLLLLPEERRFVLVYRLVFNYPFRTGEERSVRLRSARGWYGEPIPEESVP